MENQRAKNNSQDNSKDHLKAKEEGKAKENRKKDATRVGSLDTLQGNAQKEEERQA